MITSQNVSSQSQVKFFFISQERYIPFSRYLSFCIFNHPMIYVSTWWALVAFLNMWYVVWFGTICTKNVKNAHRGVLVLVKLQALVFRNLSKIRRTGTKFQALFSLATCTSYSIISYIKISMFHFFEKAIKGRLKTVSVNYCQISLYCHFNKIVKGPGTSLQSLLKHWAKNMLEMFTIQHSSISPSFILIVFRIQKK